jgi:hypothetical protein
MGYTKNKNPCRGVRKNKEKPRDYYVDAEVWEAVHAASAVELQDATDLNYLTGQRPGRKPDSYLVTLPTGEQLKQWNLRQRFDTASAAAVDRATEVGKKSLAARIIKFQFRDIRAKSASEITDIKAASELLGHTEADITNRVYRRIGQAVVPTR